MFLSKKKLLTGLTALLCVCSLRAQTPYWQQRVDYTIDVSLNDQQHTLDAFARIIYYNQSPDTLHYIWFHLWPNAYKNDKTALSDQLLENGSTRFYFATQEERGYINRLDFKVNDQHAETADHPNYIDIIRLMLPTPLPPGQKVTITTPFHVKLPEVFSRSGHEGQRYQITQWYPKPAVYDRDGWHPLPYLDQGEFYSNFGTYDVHITLPSNYVVAATGQLMDESEKNCYNCGQELVQKGPGLNGFLNDGRKRPGLAPSKQSQRNFLLRPVHKRHFISGKKMCWTLPGLPTNASGYCRTPAGSTMVPLFPCRVILYRPKLRAGKKV